MKTKLFENIEGNKFRLLKESTLDENKSYIKSGLKKVFTNADGNISYRQVETVGLGYIRDINEAKRFALQEAREIAESFGYKDDENEDKFIKDSPNVRPLKKEEHGESDMSNPEEKREVVIGKELLQIVEKLYPHIPREFMHQFMKIKLLASELVRIHGVK
jgi:hypothetical protein